MKKLLWYIKSDVELITTKVWCLDNVERIDGFYFLTKRPFSKAYQFHSTLGLEKTYKVLDLIQRTIKEKKKCAVLTVTAGLGWESVAIWKGSLKKAEKLMFDMIKEIQKQY